MKGSREAFTFIPCHLAVSQIYCPPHPHGSFLVPPTISSATFVCLPLSPSHSYDLGVGVAPIPSQPWIKLPCHYSVVPPVRVLHVRHSGACLPACCLPLRTCGLALFNHRRPWSEQSLQLWHRLPGKLCRRVRQAAALAVNLFSISCVVKKTSAYRLLSISCRMNGLYFNFFCCYLPFYFLPRDTKVFTGSVVSHTTSPPRSCVTSQPVICGPHRFMVM